MLYAGRILFVINKFAYHFVVEVYVAVFGVLILFSFTLKMEAVDSPEIMINTYKTIVRSGKNQPLE